MGNLGTREAAEYKDTNNEWLQKNLECVNDSAIVNSMGEALHLALPFKKGSILGGKNPKHAGAAASNLHEQYWHNLADLLSKSSGNTPPQY